MTARSAAKRPLDPAAPGPAARAAVRRRAPPGAAGCGRADGPAAPVRGTPQRPPPPPPAGWPCRRPFRIRSVGRRLLVGIIRTRGRPAAVRQQLGALLSHPVAAGLGADFERAARADRPHWTHTAIVRTVPRPPAEGVAELCATVQAGGRVRAVAMRLEAHERPLALHPAAAGLTTALRLRLPLLPPLLPRLPRFGLLRACWRRAVADAGARSSLPPLGLHRRARPSRAPARCR